MTTPYLILNKAGWRLYVNFEMLLVQYHEGFGLFYERD